MRAVFAVYADDGQGVLNRVPSLLRRRGFQLVSLAFGDTEAPGLSRMTLVVETDEVGALRVEAHLCKLWNVTRVDRLAPHAAVMRDLALVKVAATALSRPDIMRIVDVFRGRIVDAAADSLVIEITGARDKIDGLVDMLRPYGVLEVVRSGRVAMARGAPSTADAPEPADDPAASQVTYSV